MHAVKFDENMLRLDCHTFENLFILPKSENNYSLPKYIKIKNTPVLWISSLFLNDYLQLSLSDLNI